MHMGKHGWWVQDHPNESVFAGHANSMLAAERMRRARPAADVELVEELMRERPELAKHEAMLYDALAFLDELEEKCELDRRTHRRKYLLAVLRGVK